MKTKILILSLATVFTTPLFAGETLNLKLVPEREFVLKHQPQEMVIKIDLSAIDDKKRAHRTPLNLAVVLDKSGSMAGAKLEKAKQAAMLLVDRLTPDDVFSFVIYSDDAQVVVSAQHVEDKDRLKAKIRRVEADGSTALYAGVKLGAEQLDEYLSNKRINRVILLSDGLANVGPSSPRDLRRFGRDLAERDVSVTTIGVGDDYNEDLMAGLAEASDANYYYVKDTEKLPEIFAKELGEMFTVAARDVRIEVTCPDGVKPMGFLGRTEKFDNQKAVVNLSQLAAGQDRYLMLRCVVDGDQPEVARVRMDYTDELDGGKNRSTDGIVKVRLTADPSAADKSIDGTVAAEKQLMLTAVAKDTAMAEADAGNYKKAATILAAQKDELTKSYSAAAGTVQVQIRSETENLDNFSQQLGAGSYDSGTRKAMQSQSYNTRNSKVQ